MDSEGLAREPQQWWLATWNTPRGKRHALFDSKLWALWFVDATVSYEAAATVEHMGTGPFHFKDTPSTPQ
jgi:hypothetical protein